jgi:hypothetical protein
MPRNLTGGKILGIFREITHFLQILAVLKEI